MILSATSMELLARVLTPDYLPVAALVVLVALFTYQGLTGQRSR